MPLHSTEPIEPPAPSDLSGPRALQGHIMDIQRCSLHDGPGIRTTVFLKGCPLHCSWCHNPESQSFQEEMMESATQPGRFEPVGKWMTVAEVLERVVRDRDYFAASGGGLTLSGGEPMAQPRFTKALLTAVRKAGLHTCLDTSGAASAKDYLAVMKSVDLFLYDVKIFEDSQARRHVGRTAHELLSGLHAVDARGGVSILRCPIIPGLNDTSRHLKAIAALANSLRGVREIHIIPYHSFGNQKRSRLRRCDSFTAPVADPAEVTEWLGLVQARTSVPVTRG